MRAKAVALLAALAGAPIALAAGDAVGDALSFRSELIPVQTTDLTTAALLTATPGTTDRTIAGELSLPLSSGAARLPAVILMHGDGGLIGNQPPWVRALNRAGIAVFSLDSSSGRGAFAATQSLAIIGAASVASRLVDAHRALDTLARHPRIDADRVALMGFSSGGTVARLAAMQRFTGMHAAAGQRFAAFVALYPNCAAQLRDDSRLVPVPVRIHHGSADTITSAAYCEEWARRARAEGADIDFVEHERAGHGFDMVDAMPIPPQPDLPNYARCRVGETDDARLVNVDTGQPLSPTDSCVGKGLRGGPDADARTAARAAVIAFLVSVLKAGGR